jgi:hypothetical protein
MSDTDISETRAHLRAEKIRVLRLALAAFVVENAVISRELKRTGSTYMGAAIDAELKIASDLLSECPNLVV